MILRRLLNLLNNKNEFEDIKQCDKLLFNDAIDYSRTIRKDIRVKLSDRELVISTCMSNTIIDYKENWKEKHMPETFGNFFV